MRPMTTPLAIALAMSIVAGCLKREHGAPAAAATRAPATVQPKVGEATAVFRPPSDGRLTTGSVERYIAVQKRASELAKGVRLGEGLPPGDAVAQLATADFRAAQELGYDPGEYRWVRETVAEALGAPAESMNVDGVLNNLTAATVGSLEAQRAETQDFAERVRLGDEIARIKAGHDRRDGATAIRSSNPAVLEDNRKLLEAFRAQLQSAEGPAPGQLPKVAIASKPPLPETVSSPLA